MIKQPKTNKITAVILAIIVIGIFAGNVWAETNRMSRLPISVEAFITADGTVYDLHEEENKGSLLRMISPEGRLLMRFPLDKPADREEVYRSIVDVIDGTAYLFEYKYTSPSDDDPFAAVFAIDLKTGMSKEVYSNKKCDSIPNLYEYLASDRIWGDELFFGYLVRDENDSGIITSFEVVGVNIRNGEARTLSCAPSAFLVSQMHVTEDDTIIASSPDSKIWQYNSNASGTEKWKELYSTEGLDAITNMSVGGDGSVYAHVVSADGNSIYQVYPKPATVPIHTELSDAMRVELYDEDTWFVSVFEHETHMRSFEISANGKVETITKLTVPIHLTLNTTMLFRFLGESILAAAIVLLIRHIYLRKKMRMIVKQVIIALPIFAVGLVILYGVISDRITDEMYKKTHDELLLQSWEMEEQIDSKRFSEIDWSDPADDEYYEELVTLLDKYSHSEKLTWISSDTSASQNGEVNSSEFYSEYWLFRIDEDRAYTVICGGLYANLDSHYIDADQRYELVDLLLERSGSVVGKTYGAGGGGYWLNVLYPIKDNGKLIGFIEAGRPTAFVDNAVDEIMRSIFIIVGLVLGISLAAYILVLGFSLRALEALKHGAQKIANGDYSTRVHISATDETADIAAAFNQMGESIEESYRHVKAMRDGYRYFVPEKMLAILGRESIAEIAPGHYAHLRAGYLLLSTDSFDAYRDKAFFDALNRFYACVIPHIADTGGIIERYNGRGLAAIFDSSPETALNALISMFAALDQAGDTLRSDGGSAVECHAMLSLSDSLLGVIGNEKRLNMIAISRLTYESERVGRMCRLYGCRVILTQSVYDELGTSVSAFRHRLLGRISDSGKEVSAYDFYDAEIPELMRGKDETRDTFERAVGLYYEGDYAAARRLFIEVIKQSPKDLAAREYLKESHTRMASGLPPKPLLEI